MSGVGQAKRGRHGRIKSRRPSPLVGMATDGFARHQ